MAANGNGGGFDGVAFGDGSATPSRAVAGSSAGGIRASNRSVDKLLDMDTKLEAREVDEPKDDPSEPKPFVERVKEFIKKDYYVPREAIRGEIAAGLVVTLVTLRASGSALEAFNAITSDYAAIGKRVHLRFLAEDNHRFLAKGRAKVWEFFHLVLLGGKIRP